MAEIMNFKRNSKIYLSGNEIGFQCRFLKPFLITSPRLSRREDISGA
jgi:hypothetical protein